MTPEEWLKENDIRAWALGWKVRRVTDQLNGACGTKMSMKAVRKMAEIRCEYLLVRRLPKPVTYADLDADQWRLVNRSVRDMARILKDLVQTVDEAVAVLRTDKAPVNAELLKGCTAFSKLRPDLCK
jgi:hypothetical protein